MLRNAVMERRIFRTKRNSTRPAGDDLRVSRAMVMKSFPLFSAVKMLGSLQCYQLFVGDNVTLEAYAQVLIFTNPRRVILVR